MVCSNCQRSLSVCLCLFVLFLFRIACWSSAGKELSSWLSACAFVTVCRLNCLYSFPVWCPGQDVEFD